MGEERLTGLTLLNIHRDIVTQGNASRNEVKMGEERLTGQALTNINRDIAVSVDNVIDRFAKAESKKRHMDFVV